MKIKTIQENGQEKVPEKDGYFTTFTSLDNKKYIEYKQNCNASWSNNPYWDGTMETDGCGITALSVILSGYTDLECTPEDLRKMFYPVLDPNKISGTLENTYGIKNTNFVYDNVRISNGNIQEHLKTNRPVLICVWDKPKKNRWTEVSHYMVLLATDDNDMVYVSNPNGAENSSKSSGWYNINEVTPYIAKALFIEQ